MRRAEEVLQALMMMRSSMRPSFMSLGRVDWRMNTVLRQCPGGSLETLTADHPRREQIRLLLQTFLGLSTEVP